MVVGSKSGLFDRRSLLRGVGSVALAGATPFAAPQSALARNWRGLVGCIKPRVGDDSLGELIKLLPEGIGVAVTYLNLVEGTRKELSSAYGTYEKNIAYLASQHCDLISIEGAPPFMILGPDGETKMLNDWREKYKVDMFTSSQNQVEVLKALKVKKIFGVAPFPEDLRKSYAKYFEDCGVGVAAMEAIDVAFADIPNLSAQEVYSSIKQKFLAHPGGDAIYILGSSMDSLSVVQALEQDLGVPVVQPTAARVWEIQRRLHLRQPVKGYGVLLETLPI